MARQLTLTSPEWASVLDAGKGLVLCDSWASRSALLCVPGEAAMMAHIGSLGGAPSSWVQLAQIHLL